MNYLRAAINGEYDQIGDISKADCIIGQSFGAAEKGPGHINILLARYIINNLNIKLPLIMQKEVNDALFIESGISSDITIEGVPSSMFGRGLTSFDVLDQAKRYMKTNELTHPILIAQSHHIGRVCLQAIKQDIDPIIPAGLPNQFDPNSTQIWTRNKLLWIPREMLVIAKNLHAK